MFSTTSVLGLSVCFIKADITPAYLSTRTIWFDVGEIAIVCNVQLGVSKVGLSSLAVSPYTLYDKNLSRLMLSLLLFNLCLVIDFCIFEICVPTNKLCISIFETSIYTTLYKYNNIKGIIPVSSLYHKNSKYYLLYTPKNVLNMNM